MKILNKEIALREETRGVEQARAQLAPEVFEERSYSLVETQEELADRTTAVIEQIVDLPKGQEKFRKELQLLAGASESMWDAASILSQPNTGSPAIAAETEAIERLLQAKRSKGSGGSGGTPGDGSRSGQDTNQSALALLGDGDAKQAKVDERETLQATGKAGKQHPEEFRRGLDQYFELLESRK